MDLLKALEHSSQVIHSSEIASRTLGLWMYILDKGTLKEIEEMKGGDEMTLMVNSEFSALVEDLLMLYSDVQAANAAGEEHQSTGSTN
jgi:hypothetical protein